MQPPIKKKKTRDLSGRKISRKIMQPLGTKNLATSWDKKNHATLKTKNYTKFVQIGPNRLDQVQMNKNLSKLFLNELNGSKWDIKVLIGPNGFKRSHRGPKEGSKIGVQNYYELNWMAFKPRSHGSCLTSKFHPIFTPNITTNLLRKVLKKH